jgi:DNA-binding LacI/PurR family transcriptional regulator
MPVTIEDVARDLGLSASTVSKALNDYRDIPTETKVRVTEAAQRLGYHPSAAARSLRLHRTERIGVINTATSYNYDYFMELLRGVTAGAEQADYNLVLYTNVHTQPQRLQRVCRAREVDGVILMSADEAAQALDALMAEDLPVITLGRRESRPQASYIAADSVKAGCVATRHLIELGHRRIGLVSSLLDPETCAEREAGYRQALEAAGIDFDPRLIAEAPYRPGGGAEAMDAILGAGPRPTGVVTISNSLAHEALQSITSRGLRVPQDIALVAFDDTWLSLMTTPPLTSVRTPLFEMGKRSVEMLLAAIADRSMPPQRVLCPVSLVVRGSSVGAA